MKMDTLWDESLGHRLKVERGMIVDSDSSWNQSRGRDKRERSQSYDRNLNFSTISNEDDEFGFSRKKTARDPMSHRIIEKRRRDRMNNCLADLSRLVPTNYLKKGRGRIEKTEIIEMAIKHLKHLQAHPCKDPGTCEVAKSTENDHKRQYRLGFQECLSEAVRFLVEIEGLYAGDGLCFRLVNHLQTHFDKLSGGMCYTRALSMLASEDSKMAPMDVEHTVHGVQLENYHESQTATVVAESGHSNDIQPVDGFPNILKHEKDCSTNSANGNFNDTSEYAVSNGTSVVRVSSQLREMLQNPGLPKDQSLIRASPNATITHPTVLVCGSQDQGGSVSPNSKNDEVYNVYKFKNNIKHRFNADLRHQTASPTDSHSDYISLPDEDMRTHADTPKNLSNAHQSENYPSTSCHNGHSNGSHTDGNHTNGNHTNGNHTNGNHTNGIHTNGSHTNGNHTNGNRTNGCHHHPQRPYSPYPAVAELSVKIPERTANDTHHQQHSGHWETGSSCGSNPSTTPPVPRSNGSSSGYSTNGELPIGTKPKTLHGQHQHSPNASPYSRTPDNVLNRSPSPQNSTSQVTAQAVPIFALHPKGTFYIPLTIDSGYLAPYILGLEELAPVLHPVSICVNFSLCHSSALKADKLNGNSLQVRGPSQFLDRMTDRFAYGERLRF